MGTPTLWRKSLNAACFLIEYGNRDLSFVALSLFSDLRRYVLRLIERTPRIPEAKRERQVKKEISIMDIPQNVLDDVMLLLKNYLVAFYIVLPEKQQPHPRPIGSGTFVEIEGSHYILTAAHVWNKAREAKNIGLVLTDHQSSFMVLRDSISAKELWDGKFKNGDLILLS